LHAHNYRDSTGFEDINVLVIGFGNSALDIAVELSRVAKKVDLICSIDTIISF
jgi:dimethylaniline monooxygenase (N-oxide forming)